jgi:hypothetical protein
MIRCLVLAIIFVVPLNALLNSSSPAGLLLVANKGDHALGLIDPSAGRQIATIPETGVTGHEVVASPDGTRAFVPIYGNSGVGQPGTDGRTIDVVDLAAGKVVHTIDLGRGVRPHCAVFGPKDGLLYVTTELDQSVTIIDPKTLKIVGSVATGQPESHMLAVSHNGRYGYTANVGPGTGANMRAPAALALLLAWQVQPFHTAEDYRGGPCKVRCERQAVISGFSCGILVQLDPPMPEGIASIVGGDYEFIRGITLILDGTFYTAVFDPALKRDAAFPILQRGNGGIPARVAGDVLFIMWPVGREVRARIIRRERVHPYQPQPA